MNLYISAKNLVKFMIQSERQNLDFHSTTQTLLEGIFTYVKSTVSRKISPKYVDVYKTILTSIYSMAGLATCLPGNNWIVSV